ncbi:hypothetical protein C1T31_08910 [Hanstruepera neustonica]|uniref:Secreted protein n=1 Tax=Hanstruepera neustonica TaxID=1445657 RepID=A0A2K1DYL4_9FLAO|nr:hypothetical protein [Hanstruepera neustonica]PNQ73100.1 hypothetical protein C1T31_08910 [Hanstruepera neustonica]
MRHLFFIICLLSLLGNPVVAQIDDSSNPSTIIPAETNNDANSGALDIKPIDSKGLSNPNSNKINGMSVPKTRSTTNNEFSMFPKEKFGNPAEQYKERFERQEKGFEKVIEGEVLGDTEDQYLGDFKTNGKKITIAYRDYGATDGDLIRIIADDVVLRGQVLLGSRLSGFEMELKEGFNKLDFQALNMGESAPNTAELLVLDEGGNVIAQEYWALRTGVKATIIVVKE